MRRAFMDFAPGQMVYCANTLNYSYAAINGHECEIIVASINHYSARNESAHNNEFLPSFVSPGMAF